jgi:hypothetical protein
LFNLLNGAGEYGGLSLIFHLRDLFFHFNNHATRISLAHRLQHQRHHRFQAGDFLRQFWLFSAVEKSGVLIDILVYSLRYCALLNVKAAQYTTSDRKKGVLNFCSLI